MRSFIGRINELKMLKSLRQKPSASLVCIFGRRRIGKSSLVEEFAKNEKSFIQIQGLSPAESTTSKHQLDHFSDRVSHHFNTRKENFANWTEALSSLAQKVKTGQHLILLDEISWMGNGDPLFPSRLKDIWDTQLKKNPKIILVLCGSVSSWIEANILKNANFEGRISLDINLKELPLEEINEFWTGKKIRMSSLEKILLLSITGGVPKYLEEVLHKFSVEQNISRLCFDRNGFLFNEYEKIFTEIFGRKTKTYEKIIRHCLEKKLSMSELSRKLKITQNSELSEHVHHLELSGFLSRDFYYNHQGKQSKLSHLRVKDNYLRFYIKCIEPLRDRIENKSIKIKSLHDIQYFDSLLGLQFENLILANRDVLHERLEISSTSIESSSPHIQRKTTKVKAGCQIDLLIHTRLGIFYLCEFKCKKIIDKAVINEVEKKMTVLKLPMRSVVKPVLVYEGELYPPHLEEIEKYFYKIVSFKEMLEG